MLRSLRYRWYYPTCHRLRLPGSRSLFLWIFPPLWPRQWWGRKVWQRHPQGRPCVVLTLGPLEFELTTR
jgi:hypothetical protein